MFNIVHFDYLILRGVKTIDITLFVQKIFPKSGAKLHFFSN